MTGRFLNVGGSPVSIGGGTPQLGLIAFDGNTGVAASGSFRFKEVISWAGAVGSAAGQADTDGFLLSGNTPTLILETSAADKAFAFDVTGVAPMVMVRWLDPSNFIAWNPLFDATNGRFRVRTAGVNTDETIPGLRSNAGYWGVEVVGNTINMYGDGVLVASRTSSLHASATKAGIGHQSTSGTAKITRLKNGTVLLP